MVLPANSTRAQQCAIIGWDASLATSQVLHTLTRILDKNYRLSTEEEQQAYAYDNLEDIKNDIKNAPDCFYDKNRLLKMVDIIMDDVVYKNYGQALVDTHDLTEVAWQRYKYPELARRTV